MKDVFFSIIMPSYNRGDLISKAIKSVLDQEYTSWELIVIDDASTDITKEVVIGFDDHRIVYLKNEINIERSASRNRGIDVANGKYICFLDSDDYLMPNHLSEFNKVIEEKNFEKAVYYCNTYEEVDGELREFSEEKVDCKNNIEKVLLQSIGIPRTCIEKSIFKEYKLDVSISVGEDLEFWSRILQEYPLYYNPVYTTVFLNHTGRTVADGNIKTYIKSLDTVRSVIEKDNGNFISTSVKNNVLNKKFLNLARQYLLANQKTKALIILVKIIFKYPSIRLKEKLYELFIVLGLISRK